MSNHNPVKYLNTKYHDRFNLSEFPSFSASGSITGMRKIYGKDALLVKSGSYIYNVTSCPDIYNIYAY